MRYSIFVKTFILHESSRIPSERPIKKIQQFPFRKVLHAVQLMRRLLPITISRRKSGSKFAVVKAQIHAGGRGKGQIKENGINGVKSWKKLRRYQRVCRKNIGAALWSPSKQVQPVNW